MPTGDAAGGASPSGCGRPRARPIRIVIVDDQELVRSGFSVILGSAPDFRVVGEAASGAEARDVARRLRPDVVCMDIEMPGSDGITATADILADAAQVADWDPAVLMLTTFGSERYLFAALTAGASGFLLKTSRAEDLLAAVRTLADGGAVLSPDVTRAVIARATVPGDDWSGEGAGGGSDAPGAAAAPVAPEPPGATGGPVAPAALSALDAAMAAAGLTERETEVLRLVAQGKTNGEIAAELFLGEATVKTHLSNLLRKIGARDRIHAVVWAHTRAADPGR